MFFRNKRSNHICDFRIEENKRYNQMIRNEINKLLEEEKSGKSVIWSFRERDLQSIAHIIYNAKLYGGNTFIMDSDLGFEYQRLKKQCEDHLKQECLGKARSYNNKIKEQIVYLLKYEQQYGMRMWEYYCKKYLDNIDHSIFMAKLGLHNDFKMEKDLLDEYQRFKVQYDEYLQNRKKEEAKKSFDNMSINEIKLRLENEKKLKEQEEKEK